MPTYDYKCAECEHEFEEILKVDERNIPEQSPCPECQKNAVTLKLAAPSIGDMHRLFWNRKMPSQMKERLKEIKKHHPRGKIDI